MIYFRVIIFIGLILIGPYSTNALNSNEEVPTYSYTYHKSKNNKEKKTTKRIIRSRVRHTVSNNSNLKTVYIQAHSLYLKSYAENLVSSYNMPGSIPKQISDTSVIPDNSTFALKTPFKQLNWSDIAPRVYVKNGKMYVNEQNLILELTLDPDIQAAAERYLDQERITLGATVIIEPKTGRILAMAQNGGSQNAKVSVSAKAPAASLIKIITASASIEKENIDPDDQIYFRGGCGYLRNQNWMYNPARDRQKLTFARAFGSSCNTVFGRLALYEAGLSSLKKYAEKYLFNIPIPSDVKIQTSLFLLPDLTTASPQEVAEAGAGFGATKLSPIHAALLSATIGNSGVMMAPYLVESATNLSGVEVYRAKPVQASRVISRKTAHQVETLMLETISSGTSRRAFRRRGTRADIDEIGGKTGTLLDPENRDLLYTWFSGIAPLNSPNSIAIGTIVASQQNWVVRASSVAQNTLADYLKLQKKESKVAIRNK